MLLITPVAHLNNNSATTTTVVHHNHSSTTTPTSQPSLTLEPPITTSIAELPTPRSTTMNRQYMSLSQTVKLPHPSAEPRYHYHNFHLALTIASSWTLSPTTSSAWDSSVMPTARSPSPSPESTSSTTPVISY